MAKHPAHEHHQSAADKHKAAEEAHRRAAEAHDEGQHDAAYEHAEQAGIHATEAARHGQRARESYQPRPSRTDLPPEASGLDQNPQQPSPHEPPPDRKR